MDSLIQWAVTTIIAILAIVAGRIWERHDYRLKKDRSFLEEILKIVPKGSEPYIFLKQHDFGDAFRNEPLKPLRELELLLEQPGNFFLNNKLEKMKLKLLQEIKEFDEVIREKTFPHHVKRDFYELPRPDDVLIARARIIRSYRELPDEEFDEMESETRKDFQKVREQLNSMSDNICKAYDALISSAHRIL
jgi:hypothetical protein